MHQEERILKVLAYLNEHNYMSIHDICEMFNVSRDTARRDIVRLINEEQQSGLMVELVYQL